MKKILILIVSMLFLSNIKAAEIVINLTEDETQAFQEMLGEQTIEEYLKSIANAHIVNTIDNELKNMTIEEKKDLLKK